MKKLYVSLFALICFIGCTKPVAKDDAREDPRTQEAVPALEDHNPAPKIPVEELSLDGLVGKWMLLDSEGEIDPSGDYLFIERKGDAYQGVFVYQGTTRLCTLRCEDNSYYVIANSGERYEISRIRSMFEKEHNGIGLALIVPGIDDIPLGFFQREDVLKKFAQ